MEENSKKTGFSDDSNRTDNNFRKTEKTAFLTQGRNTFFNFQGLMQNSLANSNFPSNGNSTIEIIKKSEKRSKRDNSKDIKPIIPEKKLDTAGAESKENQVNNKNSNNKIIQKTDNEFNGGVFNMNKKLKNDNAKQDDKGKRNQLGIIMMD